MHFYHRLFSYCLSSRNYNQKVVKCVFSTKFVDVTELALKSYRKGNKSLSDFKRNMEYCDKTIKHHKYREKMGGTLPAPSRIELYIAGSGSSGTAKAMFVVMDHFNYLFNCGEGTQRLAIENKIKLARIESIFVTNLTWKNVCGLTGVCLTMQDNHVPFVKIYGPPNVDNVVEMSRNFTQLNKFKIDISEATETSVEDDAMVIDQIPIYSEKHGEPKHKKAKLFPTKLDDRHMSVVYVCKPHCKARKVDIDRCVELEIPRNQTMRKLMAGEAVTLPNGRVVTVKDILTPKQDKRCLIVVDCPDEDFINPLINSNITQYQINQICDENITMTEENPSKSEDQNASVSTDTNDEDGEPVKTVIDIVVHFSPVKVLQNEKYQQWMRDFGPDTKHLLLNDLCSDRVLKDLYEIQANLNLIHPEIFPLLPHQLLESSYNESPVANAILAEPGMKYILRRSKDSDQTFERENIIKLDNKEFVQEALEDENFKLELERFNSKAESQESTKIDLRQYPEVIFLGTGSAIPNKVRNVSAVLVHLSESECIFLDCGEDCYGQLFRHYGDKTDDVLQKLKAVFVSHLHADHHMGITTLVHQREKSLQKKKNVGKKIDTTLVLLAPAAFKNWIKAMSKSGLLPESMIRHIPVEKLVDHETEGYSIFSNVFKELLNIQHIATCRVNHRQFPHALRMTLANDFTLVYSGDTTPCDALVKLGMNCDLLIHEATMDDDLMEDAQFKKHSTTSQAIDAGINMNAGFTILTHFSQRYSKLPLFTNRFTDKVGIAFDNMRVRPCDFHILPQLTPVFKALFADDYAKLEETIRLRSAKKRLKEQEMNKLIAEKDNADQEEDEEILEDRMAVPKGQKKKLKYKGQYERKHRGVDHLILVTDLLKKKKSEEAESVHSEAGNTSADIVSDKQSRNVKDKTVESSYFTVGKSGDIFVQTGVNIDSVASESTRTVDVQSDRDDLDNVVKSTEIDNSPSDSTELDTNEVKKREDVL